MHETWTTDALYAGCSQLVNPTALQTSTYTWSAFHADLHEEGETGITPLDASEKLGCAAPATSPNLCASFVRIGSGEQLATNPNASSQLFYVIRGHGRTQWDGQVMSWSRGDIFTLPVGLATHLGDSDSAFYWVHDEPLLTYLGVRAAVRRFQPTLYKWEDLHQELAALRAGCYGRVSVSLANRRFEQSGTATHVLRATYGLLPAGECQPPHRHQSAALDYVIDCRSHCWTLLGEELDEHGNIRDPVRIDWKTGSMFVTPSGWWHAHYNDTAGDAYLLPVQDAGLHIYMKSLDIQVFDPHEAAVVLLK
jgi:gentisate 1,2-dioxygenase